MANKKKMKKSNFKKNNATVFKFLKVLDFKNGAFSYLFIAIAIVFILFFFLLKNSSFFNVFSQAFVQKVGFVVEDFAVFGRHRSSKEEILDSARVEKKQNILNYDLNIIKNNLEKLEWIKSVVVHRMLTGAIYIYIREREPIAIYHEQKENVFFLVDKDGELIKKPIASCFRNLPVLSGKNSEKQVWKILSKINNYKLIKPKLTAMSFVQERRWDLKLNNAVIVKLPENKVEKALEILELLIFQGKVLAGEVLLIDLRIEGKVVFKLASQYWKNHLLKKSIANKL